MSTRSAPPLFHHLPHRLSTSLLLAVAVLLGGVAVAMGSMRWLQDSLHAQARVRFEFQVDALESDILARFEHAFLSPHGHAGSAAGAHGTPPALLAGQGPGAGPRQGPAWREALERLKHSGEPVLSPALTLPGDRRPAFLVLLPHQHAGAAPAARPMPDGVLQVPILVHELLTPSAGRVGRNIAFDLHDGAGADAPRVYEGWGRGLQPLFTTERLLQVGGRALWLHVRSSSAFDADVRQPGPQWVGAGGVLASVLLALLVGVLARGRARAQALAAGMTAELNRLARVAQCTGNAVLITDAAFAIEWVNPGFTQLFGHTLDDARGRTPMALLGGRSGDAALRVLAQGAQALHGGQLELVLHHRDGSPRHVEAELQPALDAHGAVEGYMLICHDRTAQRAAEQDLAAARGEAGALLHTLREHVIVSVSDRQGRILEVNDHFLRLTGYAPDELVGRTHSVMASGVHPKEFWAGMWSTILDGRPWRGQVCNRTRDGRLVWFDSLIAPIRDAGGRVAKFISIRFDVTATHEAREALARERQRLAHVIEGADVGTWECTPEGECLHVNERCATLLGWSLSEFTALGRDAWLRYTHPEDLPAAQALLRQHAEGALPYYSTEFRMRHRDGHWVWILSRGRVATRDAQGRALTVAGTHVDITPRKQVEEALRQRERFMRIVTDQVPGPVSYWTPQLRCTFANRAYVDWHGLTPEQVQGRTLQELLGVERFTYNEPYLRRALAGQPQRLERSSVKADGTPVQFWLHYLPDVEDGVVQGLVVVCVDVSELKAAQQRLEESLVMLERRTAHAEAASVAKSQFLANMSHEIRTPMNAILGMLALLRRTRLDARQDDYADKAAGAARSLLGLLNDILDFSKVEAGRLELEPRPFRPARVLAELQAILQASVGDKPLALRMTLDPALPPVLVGDALRLQQVLLNLGGNAVKFTPRGEVTVALSLLERRGATVVLELAVRDTGIGIAAEQQGRIFDAFTQAEASTTRRFGGTGLGLAIARRLVRLMGAELLLDSAPGVGSRFHCRLELPVATPAQAAALAQEEAPAAQLATGALAGLRLLVAEDNANNRQVARELLEAEGAQVQLAANGREAVAAVAAGGIDAVLMDVQMPEMDGYTATDRIRQALGLTRLPIIAMTANALPADREACLAAGMDDHVGKPFDLRHLVALLRRHTGLEAAVADDAPAAPAPAVSEPPPGVPAALLDVEGALTRLGRVRTLYQRLLRDTRAELQALPGEWAQLLQTQGATAAAQALHRSRGVAATLGALRLAQAAAELERALLSGGAVPPALAQALDETLHATLAAMDAAVDGNGGAHDAGPPLAAAALPALRSLLHELADLLVQADLGALGVHARLQALLPEPERRGLDEALARLDLEAALAQCRELMQRLEGLS